MRPILAPVVLSAVLLPLVAACTTYRETTPAHTATEELLTSHAAEMAADRLAARLPPSSAVYVDATHFKGDGSDYALATIEAALLRHGMVLTPDQKASKLTVVLRMGALSIDQHDTILGIPGGYLPIPGTLTAFPIPELSLYSSNVRVGKAEFAAAVYNTATLAPVAFVGPVGGARKLVQKRYLTVFSRGGRLEEAGRVDGKKTPAP